MRKKGVIISAPGQDRTSGIYPCALEVPTGYLWRGGKIGYRDKESKGGTGVMHTSLGRPNIPEERRLCGKVNYSSL